MVSGLQDRNSLLTGLSSSQTVNPVSGLDSSYDDTLASLFSSIASGDTENAEKYLAAVKQYPAAQSNDTSTPLGSFLASVTDSLGNGDIAEAQSALQTLQSYSTSSTAETTTTATGASLETSYSASSFGTNVFTLANAISSNDLDEALNSYNDLTELISNDSFLSSSGELGESLSEDTSTTVQFQQIGSSLEAGNITSAQMALDGFLTSLSAGSLISAKA
jgi:hypothetical protein